MTKTTISKVNSADSKTAQDVQKPDLQEQPTIVIGHAHSRIAEEYKRRHILHISKFLSKRAEPIDR